MPGLSIAATPARLSTTTVLDTLEFLRPLAANHIPVTSLCGGAAPVHALLDLRLSYGTAPLSLISLELLPLQAARIRIINLHRVFLSHLRQTRTHVFSRPGVL